MATSRSADAPKQEPGIKSADGKGSQTKQAASKIRKKEINQPQNESGSTARGRKTGAQQTEAGDRMGFQCALFLVSVEG